MKNYGKIGFAQLVLAVGSIVMIILNLKAQTQVISGYLLALGALLIEFIMPSILSVYTAFVSSGLYMKSGSTIRNKNLGNEKKYRQIKRNTDWFYADKDK